MSNCRAFGSDEGMIALLISVRTRIRSEWSRTSSRRNQQAAGMELEFVLCDRNQSVMRTVTLER